MVSPDSTQPAWTNQSPKSGYGFLAAILDGLKDHPLLDVLQDYRRTGRPGYPIRAMWRAYLVKFLLKIRYNNQLLERLRGSRKLREVCGLGDAVPSESSLSRFVTRLADHQPLVEQCLVDATEELAKTQTIHRPPTAERIAQEVELIQPGMGHPAGAPGPASAPANADAVVELPGGRLVVHVHVHLPRDPLTLG